MAPQDLKTEVHSEVIEQAVWTPIDPETEFVELAVVES
jgi:hypothetical protein